MSLLLSERMDLVDILSQAVDLSENTGLDFDDVADQCGKARSLASPPSARANASAASSKGATAKKAGKTQAKKRTWKKPKDKPRRPLSAYNLFFKNEREKIVMATAEAEGRDPVQALKEVRTIITKDGKRKRNRNRKSSGKIGFAALAKNIAEKWKALDDVSKSPFEARALKEKERYQAELEKWNKEQELKREKLGEAAMENITSGNTSADESKKQGKPKGQPQRNSVPRKPSLPLSLATPCVPKSSAQMPFEQLFSPQKDNINFAPKKQQELKKHQQQAFTSQQLLEILDQATAVLESDCILTSNAAPKQQQQQQPCQDIPAMPGICDSSMNKNMLPSSSWMKPMQQSSLDTSYKSNLQTLYSTCNNPLQGMLGANNNLPSSSSSFGFDIPEPSMLHPNTQSTNLGDFIDDDDLELFNLLSS